MRRLAWILGVCACGDDVRPEPDAPGVPPGSFQYLLRVTPSEPPDRPPAAAPAKVYIDGVARTALDLVYPDEGTALGERHVVELRAGAAVLASYELVIDREGCLDRFDRASLLQQDLCAFDSGDLRFASERAAEGERVCYGDGFCFPRCFDDSSCASPAEPRCTSRATSEAPFASHLACAPAGPRALGESCALVADPAGAYDDCALGLLCVAGACRRACRPRSSDPGCNGCTYVPGHAPEIGVCPSPATR
ncbi:MAG: hypothetical protein KF773_13640 [Deltaproteobacteria bacterium]|nr:hypothetical protein [Deltaproteobacteria bacterium]